MVFIAVTVLNYQKGSMSKCQVAVNMFRAIALFEHLAIRLLTFIGLVLYTVLFSKNSPIVLIIKFFGICKQNSRLKKSLLHQILRTENK